MEDILGDRKTVQGQSTISSTFANCKKNPKLKSTMLPQSDTFIARSDSSIGDEICDELPSTSSSVNTNSAKRRIYENLSKSRGLDKNKQAIKKMELSNTKTECSTSVSNTQSKRPQHGSGSRAAASKIELEKQWLHHLKNLTDRDEIKKIKQEAYEKRKAEEMQVKKKLIALKERQLDIKQNIAQRKQEEAEDWHREKLNIEKQKCRLLRELLETRTLSHSKRFKTGTDNSYED
ncbi:hypothetical protein EAG_15488 [Camponotus floridanus]|uniref:Uncharacterized protein n=1 Tax=Camponotus floridanus TaxID=104421 RepID=E2AYK5_CAMFO|nr:hypothetical protein EAG_15488 [Camponotus floridanus]